MTLDKLYISLLSHFLMCKVGIRTVSSYRVAMGLNEIIHIEAHYWHLLYNQCLLKIITQTLPHY